MQPHNAFIANSRRNVRVTYVTQSEKAFSHTSGWGTFSHILQKVTPQLAGPKFINRVQGNFYTVPMKLKVFELSKISF